MPAAYTPFDTALANKAYFLFHGDTKPGSQAADTIDFQFPPKITTDNRKGEWIEADTPNSEPNAAFKKSGAREMTLVITYIVDGGLWTTSKIAHTVKRFRGYFHRRPSHRTTPRQGTIVFFKLWLYGDPVLDCSCRIKSVDVKHSETIVCDGSMGSRNPKHFQKFPDLLDEANNSLNYAYPLRTDITLDMRVWTTTSGINKSSKDLATSTDEKNPNSETSEGIWTYDEGVASESGSETLNGLKKAVNMKQWY